MNKLKTRVLVVEDDENLGRMLADYLRVKEFDVTLAKDGVEGFKSFIDSDPEICLLDVMMPKKDGFTLAKEIRDIKPKTPIIFLTAKSMEEDVKKGFSLGADDYIAKPFSMEVLLMRVNAIMRRINIVEEDLKEKKEFKIKDFVFFPEKRIISKGGVDKKLTSKENELLRLLCMYVGEIVDRNDALNMIWGDDNYFNSRSMDVYVTKLRKVFKEDPNIQILNSHGKGFKLLVE